MVTETQTKPSHRRGLAANDLNMLLVVLIWGANFSVVKVTFAQISPLAFTTIRFIAASSLLGLILWWREGSLGLWGKNFWHLVWLGVVGNTFYQICFILGLSITTAANSALLLATTPALVALLGGLMRLERITRSIGWGIALACLGVTLVMAARGAALSQQTIWGDLLTLGGVICWAIYTLGVRELSEDISPLRITTLTTITGTPGLILAGLPRVVETDWMQISLAAWGGLAYATIGAIVLAYLLWNSSVRAVGSSRTAIYSCVTPLIATIVAWPLLGERPVPLQAIGAGLIVLGVLLTRR